MSRTLIVYESMFGATRHIAEAIARGARDAGGQDMQVVLRRVGELHTGEISDSDILVLGGPTHAHSMSRSATRSQAEKWAADAGLPLTLEPDAVRTGVRELIAELPPSTAAFVAFDTLVDAPEVFTGSAARGIRKRLKKKGLVSLLPAQSFLVDKDGRLLDGEDRHAEELGHAVVKAAAARAASANPVPL
jgi:hypothetical protein